MVKSISIKVIWVILAVASFFVYGRKASAQGYEYMQNNVNISASYFTDIGNIQMNSVQQQNQIGMEEILLRTKLMQTDMTAYRRGDFEPTLNHFGYEKMNVHQKASLRQVERAERYYKELDQNHRNYLSNMFMAVVRSQQGASAQARAGKNSQPETYEGRYGKFVVENFRTSNNIIDLRGVDQVPSNAPWNGRNWIPIDEYTRWEDLQGR